MAATTNTCSCRSHVQHALAGRVGYGPPCAGEYRSTRKPCSEFGGYVASLRTGPLLPDGRRGWCVIIDLDNPAGQWAGNSEDGGRWLTLCNTHATLVQHTSLRAARATMKSGTLEFCDECRDLEVQP